MIGIRPAPQPARSAAQRCEEIERQIEETASSIEVATGKIQHAKTPADLAALRSQVDFAEMRRASLILERIAVEEARLAEIADAAEKAWMQDNPLPELVARRKQLDADLRALELQIARNERISKRLFQAKLAADSAAKLFRSTNPYEQAQRKVMISDLRATLERLGRVASDGTR